VELVAFDRAVARSEAVLAPSGADVEVDVDVEVELVPVASAGWP
jgi:hypothetical protein